MKVEDYIKKTNSIENISGLGAINAAIKASSMFAEPSYMKSLKELSSIPKLFSDISGQQNTLKGLSSITNAFMRNQKLTSFSDIAASSSLTNTFYNPNQYSFLANSLKGSLSDVFSKSSHFNNFHKPIEIPEIYKSNISNIVSNNNSIFEGLSSLSKNLSANGLLQTQVLSNYSAATLSATLAESIRNEKWEDIETIEDFTEDINEITNKALTTGEINNKSLEAIERTLDAIVEKLNDKEIDSDKKKILNALLNIIGVIGFIIGVISFYLQITDTSKEEMLNEIKASENRIITKVSETIQSISKRRVAIAKVNLRLKPSKKSQKLATLNIGQEVSVISINHKWLLISYVDMKSGQLMTGWVYKKCFEKL